MLQVAHGGMDAMIQRQIREARLLYQDPVSELTLDSTRWAAAGMLCVCNGLLPLTATT